jgi:hypothetical protein
MACCSSAGVCMVDCFHEWVDTEVNCEICGEHPSVVCSVCGDVIDVVFEDDPRG